MTPLRITVLMKTDVVGSTPKFRALLAADRQAVLLEHREFVARHTAEHCGRILEPAGDGFWAEFPSVTAAAKSAIDLQEALRFSQLNKGDDRLSIRIVIGLGDVAMRDGAMIGDAVSLMTRVEAITPEDQIYLTAAANLALTSAEVQTALVDSFLLKGFVQPVTVHRVEQRHRTRIITDICILVSDLRGFTQFAETESVSAVEHALDKLETLASQAVREFGGTIRSNTFDSYWVTFPQASQAMAAAEQLSQGWEPVDQETASQCPVNIAVHRGTIKLFRSFLYSADMGIAIKLQSASTQVLAKREGGIFVTNAVRDALSGSAWHGRLQPVEVKLREAGFPGRQVYRLGPISG